MPVDAGPHEHRFCKVLALFHPTELNAFYAELTRDDTCSEQALRRLEEDRPRGLRRAVQQEHEHRERHGQQEQE